MVFTRQVPAFVKMKSLCALFMLITLAVAIPHPETSTFTNKYDNVNIDEILVNTRLRDNYYNCIMGISKKCTPDAKELKEAIPKAMSNECGGCNEKQKEMAEKVLKYLYQHDKKKFDGLSDKWDKEGKVRAKYEKLHGPLSA